MPSATVESARQSGVQICDPISLLGIKALEDQLGAERVGLKDVTPRQEQILIGLFHEL